MDGLEFRPEPLPESLPLRQTRPRPRPDVNGHLLSQEGQPVALRHQSVKPDRQVAAVADAEALKFISPTSTVFRAGSFVFYDLGFFSSLRGLTCQDLMGCITSAGMRS